MSSLVINQKHWIWSLKCLDIFSQWLPNQGQSKPISQYRHTKLNRNAYRYLINAAVCVVTRLLELVSVHGRPHDQNTAIGLTLSGLEGGGVPPIASLVRLQSVNCTYYTEIAKLLDFRSNPGLTSRVSELEIGSNNCPSGAFRSDPLETWSDNKKLEFYSSCFRNFKARPVNILTDCTAFHSQPLS